MENSTDPQFLPKGKIGLIVHTCDRYKLLYTGFEFFFKKYWPYQNLAINCYFLTEEEDFSSDIFITIKTGKGEWTDRLHRGLSQVPENHILYFQEDMWLNAPVNEAALRGMLQYAFKNNTDLFKLTCNDVYQTIPTADNINGFAVALLDNHKSKFLMSHQISIWKKSFLEAQLTLKENPWQNERRGTKRLKKLNPQIFQADLIKEYDYPPINNNRDDSTVSQYYTVSENGLLNYCAFQYINEMTKDTDPDIRRYAALLHHNFTHRITHDGLSQPRKDDIFKRIKKFFTK